MSINCRVAGGEEDEDDWEGLPRYLVYTIATWLCLIIVPLLLSG